MSESKDKILQAAIDEFGRHGYRNASTNRIMKAGGISKGLIFHHYGSKKELYLACVRYVLEAYEKRMRKAMSGAKVEFPAWFDKLAAFKLHDLTENAVTGKFLVEMSKIYRHKSIPELNEIVEACAATYQTVFINSLDTSKFRKDIAPHQAIEYVMLVMNAFTEKYHFEQMDYKESLRVSELCTREFREMKEMILHGVYEERI